MSESWIQITAGTGPVECAWAAAGVLEVLERDAAQHQLTLRQLEAAPGPEPGTIESALLALEESAAAGSFLASWQGTIQWVGKSPWRPHHKRKNWFVGVAILKPLEESQLDLKDLAWDTMRASGPGGQHVNRTESAVRVTHRPTGIQVVAMEERSQLRNRKLALARLAAKLEEQQQQRQGQKQAERWRTHQSLERGNPVRILYAP